MAEEFYWQSDICMYELNFVWRHSTPITASFNRSFNPEASWFCSPVGQHSRLYTVDVSGETIRLAISLRLAVYFVHVTYIKDKQMLVFIFLFDLLWTGGGSSVSSLPPLGFREVKQIEKRGSLM